MPTDSELADRVRRLEIEQFRLNVQIEKMKKQIHALLEQVYGEFE